MNVNDILRKVPASYRRAAYKVAAGVALAVPVLGQLGVIPASAVEQVGALVAAIVTALAHANAPKV